ncbi:MAG: Zn-dependent hydrolase [Bacteroidetes bacterium]|nr:MAG: Zn-dependent hydrolase [Bacteroidota bacterium]
MKLHVIDTGYFKLDGGAMFGVVPKSLWKKVNPADDNNMCSWALRCLLVEDGNRLILVDNGIGDKQDEKFFSYYFLHGDQTLDSSLKKAGFSRDDITDVFLTHLHFDHCGGSIRWNADRTKYEPAFRNAVYWSNEEHWQWATVPNAREKASFLKENILPIKESGQLKFTKEGEEIMPGFRFMYTRGHTEAMMLPMISYKEKTIVFTADLFPCTGHVQLPWIMAYDVRPLVTLSEKEIFLKKAAEENFILFFEHDPVNECCSLTATERGIRVDKTFRLDEYFGS